MTQAGFIITLFVIVFAVSIPAFWLCFRWLRSLRKRIEKKIDEAMTFQNTTIASTIASLQTDVNGLKREIANLRTLAAYINKTPLPECMRDES